MSEAEDIINQYSNELQQEKNKNNQLNSAITSLQTNNEGNAIQYQLDTSEMLDRLKHSLKGEEIAWDEELGEHWIPANNPDLILLNEYGVNMIMSIVEVYIHRGTKLSYYDERRIMQIMGDIGYELTKFIFCNYEKMGMSGENKRTAFEVLTLKIIHTIESAYRSALRGRMSENLNSSKIFTQSELTGERNMLPQKKTGLSRFNPFK